MAEYDKIQYELIQRELAKRSYIDYLRYVHGKQWKDTKFAEFVANTVQSFLEEDTGHAYDILILESPPQHGKSMTVTESLPSWYLGRYPAKRVIEVSYNDDTATRFLRRNKDKVKRFGDMLFNIKIGGADRSDIFELSSGGSMLSRGVKAGITGNPADLMIIDDPIKNREEADSETSRDNLWAEWLSSMKSRLQARSKVIVIMTPWHEDDLRARMMDNEEFVTRVRLPVEAGEDDPMGREPGDSLCPELGKDKTWLAQFKKSYLGDPLGGARAWSALYMCNPVVEGGNMVPRTWWKYYERDSVTQFAFQCISVDATFKDGDNNDFVSIQVWGKLEQNYYLQYNVKEHLDFPGTMNKIMQIRQLFPKATRIYVEDKANGSAIIQMLQKQLPGVIGVNPLGGKVARVNAISSVIETGHVFLPVGATWLEDYIREWCEFPAGKHDDQVDASSQALNQMISVWGRLDETDTEGSERERRERRDFFSYSEFDPYKERSSYDEDDRDREEFNFGWFNVY